MKRVRPETPSPPRAQRPFCHLTPGCTPMLDDRSTMGHVEVTLPPATESVPIARHEVDKVLAEHCDDVRATVALLTSELASNAVVHGRTPFTVRARADRAKVHVAISDSGGRLPTLAVRDPTTPGGWGLLMVDSAASRWGIDADGITTVWFEVDVA